MIGTKTSPYLDMNMSFDVNQDLCFGIYMKPNFKLKYLNVGSTHHKASINTVPQGVTICLAGLTTITRTTRNEDESLSIIYPDIYKALQASGYMRCNAQIPNLGKILDNHEQEMIEAALKKEEWQKDKRPTRVSVRHSGNWQTPTHKTIKKLKEKRGLSLLRVRMCNQRHQNLKERTTSE